MSDTLAHGRVANPSPPLSEFFDTFHVIVHPVYASKYFPAQGAFLAIGEKLTGHPAVGLWLSSALACAATCWMLQEWIGPAWGLLGGLLMMVQIGIFSYWSQVYWGEMVAALGGALFFGAVHRLWKKLAWTDAIWMALGLVILANSRPLEGLLAALPVSCLFIRRIWMERIWKQPFWRELVLPAGSVTLPKSTFRHGRKVPYGGTIVAFTARFLQSILSVSSSGGGLFGRPATHASLGRFLILGRFAHYLGFQLPTQFRPLRVL